MSASSDETVCRWNIETGAMRGEPMSRHDYGFSCLAVDKNGKMIVSGSQDNTLIRWDAHTGTQIGDLMWRH